MFFSGECIVLTPLSLTSLFCSSSPGSHQSRRWTRVTKAVWMFLCKSWIQINSDIIAQKNRWKTKTPLDISYSDRLNWGPGITGNRWSEFERPRSVILSSVDKASLAVEISKFIFVMVYLWNCADDHGFCDYAYLVSDWGHRSLLKHAAPWQSEHAYQVWNFNYLVSPSS